MTTGKYNNNGTAINRQQDYLKENFHLSSLIFNQTKSKSMIDDGVFLPLSAVRPNPTATSEDITKSSLSSFTKTKSSSPSSGNMLDIDIDLFASPPPPSGNNGMLDIDIDLLLEEIHEWFIMEGSRVEGVKPFLTAYFHKLHLMKIPVDMIFGGGVLLSEYTPGYIWTCESSESESASGADQDLGDSVCAEIEISRNQFSIYTAHLDEDDPFVILRQKRAASVRLRKGVDHIPESSCAWFHTKHLTDYFAMPILHRGKFNGGFAWATRRQGGFGQEHEDKGGSWLPFFEKSMPAFSAIMRLHTNDLIMESLTVRVEEEITERTTSLKVANQELEQANQRVRQQAAAQLEHFACMSHQIRNPLNCILGLSSLLLDQEDEVLTPSQRDSIQLITSSGNLLRTVVDDVLDYTKLAAGHIDIRKEPCNLQETIIQSVRAFSGQCQKHNLKVRTFCGPNVPAFVESDNRRLSQVLYNLIGNAVKFSKDGGNIDIKLSLTDTYDKAATSTSDNTSPTPKNQQQVLKLAIKDYGKGIDEKDIESIFQPFIQTETSTSDQTYGKGSGLGLSIASRIVRGLGGTIAADSELGKWCEFTVELPYHASPNHAAVDLEQLSDRLQNVTILIVMPDSDERERLVSDVFGPYGVAVRVLKSCGDLLGQSSSARSNVVLCDHELYDQALLDSFLRWEGEKRVKIVTCGSARTRVKGHTDAHFDSLSLVFPSVLVQHLCELVECNLSGVTKTKENSAENPPPSDLPVVAEKPTATATPATTRRASFQKPTATATPAKPRRASLPVAKETTTTTSTTTTPYSGLKVLITEDNLINQKVLHRALARLGLQNVDIVDDGAKAVALTAEKPFDLIFMDIQMPVMDGLEATKLITSRRDNTNHHSNNHHSPTVIFLSAHATDSYREKAIAVGGDGFISKPFQLPMLKDVLQSVWRDHLEQGESDHSEQGTP